MGVARQVAVGAAADTPCAAARSLDLNWPNRTTAALRLRPGPCGRHAPGVDQAGIGVKIEHPFGRIVRPTSRTEPREWAWPQPRPAQPVRCGLASRS
jgi:hypothetical protein